MQFCPHCGKEINGDNSFCPRCGESLIKKAGSRLAKDEAGSRTTARIQEEIAEEKHKETIWGIIGLVLLIGGLVGLPIITIFGIPAIVIGIICLCCGLDHEKQAKKLKKLL